VTLQPRAKPYTILPTTFYPNQESPFTIRIYAKEDFSFSTTPL
jgi:hypothetical protein